MSFTTESLLDTLSGDDAIWATEATGEQCTQLVTWLAQRLATEASEHGDYSECSSATSSSLSQGTVPGGDVKEALVSLQSSALTCAHLQESLRSVRGLRRLLARRVAPPMVTAATRDGSDNDTCDFVCGGGCDDCSARAELAASLAEALGEVPPVPGPSPVTGVHAHCCGCLETFLTQRQSVAGTVMTCGCFCLAHVSAHWEAHRATTNRIIQFLDGDSEGECTTKGRHDSTEYANDGSESEDEELLPEDIASDAPLSIGGRNFPSDFDAAHDDDVRTLEEAAQDARRHVAFIMSAGPSHMHASVLYCAECRVFAPLHAASPPAAVGHVDVDAFNTSEGLQRDHLGGDEIGLSTGLTFTQIVQAVTIAHAVIRQQNDVTHHQSIEVLPDDTPTQLDDCEDDRKEETVDLNLKGIYLYKAVLFHEDDDNDALENDAVATFVDVWLPHAMSSTPDGLLQRCFPEATPTASEAAHTSDASDFQVSSAIRGFLVCFDTCEAAQLRVNALKERFPAISSTVERVYLATEEAWVDAHVVSYKTKGFSTGPFSTPDEVEVDVVTDKVMCRASTPKQAGPTIMGPVGATTPASCPLSGDARNMSVWQSATHLALLIGQLRTQSDMPTP